MPSIFVVSFAVPVGHLFVHTPGRAADIAESNIYPTAQPPQFVEFTVQFTQLALQLAQVHVEASANCVVKQLELATHVPESR